MPYPTLRFGSFGEPVKLLQNALNLWPQTMQPALTPDGQFGPKTNNKVKEYQSRSQLVPDGVVGPLTWAQLEPLVQQVTKLVPIPKDDAAMGQRIVAVAEAAFGAMGWGANEQPGQNAMHIAAALRSGTGQARQGGGSLQQIMMIAEAGGSYIGRCPTISDGAVTWWQKQDAAGTAWRNNNDLCAWCGIFCIYVYRCAGINVPGGWSQHQKNVFNPAVFRRVSDKKSVLPGAIGVVAGIKPGGRNHHFIVTGNDGSQMTSIDGNAFGPDQNNMSQGCKSVIARRTYSYASLAAEEAYFLFPAAQP